MRTPAPSRILGSGNSCRLVAVVVLALCCDAAEAQWIPDGVPLCSGCSSNLFYAAADGAGGAFVAWRDNGSPQATGTDIYAQRIRADGFLAPGWPARGVGLCVVPQDQNIFGLALDGQGGALVAWSDQRGDNDVYAQRVFGHGEIAPGWIPNGSPVSLAQRTQWNISIASDGSGGAILAWEDSRQLLEELYAQRVDSTGLVTTGWPLDGLRLAIGGGPEVLSDGEGGAWIVWSYYEASTDSRFSMGTRLHENGAIASGWPAGGKVLMAGRSRSAIPVSDGTGGFFVVSSTVRSGFAGEHWVQRFTADGEVHPDWPDSGLKVCGAPGVREGLRAVSDGQGGVLLTWYDYRIPGGVTYAARVLSSGALAPGWTPDGTLVSDATAPGVEYDPVITPDGMGGAYVAWIIENTGFRAYIQHLTPEGQVAPGWPQYGARVSTSSGQFHPEIVSDGAGGAILVWEERGAMQGLFAQRFRADGIVSTVLSFVSAEAEPGLIRLEWEGEPHLVATIERRHEREASWSPLATLTGDASGRLRHEDASVTSGERYAYRLRYDDQGVERTTIETWVSVPNAFALTLEGLRPNPANRDLKVAFTVPSREPARLELLDVTGRQRLAHDFRDLAPGGHTLDLGSATALEPGVYWIRLSQGQEARLARGVVIR